MDKFIDITFDFRTDTPPGKDPDALSPTLRSYHKFLWSKPLPNGVLFKLNDTKNKVYLYHQSHLGEFFLSSDSAIHTFSKWKKLAHIIDQLQDGEAEVFRSLSYTMGGMIIFPANKIEGKNTINGARGFHPLIRDRIDLTLECIRRYYNNEISPLTDTLIRYADFFALFGNFKGYIEFFLLQDLVTKDVSAIKFFMPFDDFKSPVVPKTLDEYLSYKYLTIKFVNKRNQRILESI
ncbi:MAG: hypothetical protein WCJ35_19370 [Planctomycetota bacterium]